MLVLSRKENETIVIDGNIHVTIVRCGRGKVRIGIEAPDDVSINRAEIADQKRDDHGRQFLDISPSPEATAYKRRSYLTLPSAF